MSGDLHLLRERLAAALDIADALIAERDAAAEAELEGQKFPDFDLIDVSTAAVRFRRPPDTIRHWCETEDMGVKVGGRWKVSVARLRAKLKY